MAPITQLEHTPDHLSDLSRQVYAIVAQHTAFPWPLLTTRCRRLGVDAASLTAADIRTVTQPLALAVAQVSTPRAAIRMRLQLQDLARNADHTEMDHERDAASMLEAA